MSPLAPISEPVCRLAELRCHVETLLDSDNLLPADGHALLDMLQQAEERVAAGDAAGASGLLLGFETLLKALLDTGVLDTADGCAVIATVRRILNDLAD